MPTTEPTTTQIGALTVTISGPGTDEVMKLLLSTTAGVPNADALLLGTDEVAAKLGVTRQAAWRWGRDGVLPPPDAVSPGGHKRWRADSIERFAACPPTARLAKWLKITQRVSNG